MKKVLSAFMCLPFLLILVLTLVYPMGSLATSLFGYSFDMIAVPQFTAIIGVLSVVVVILDLFFRDYLKSTFLQVVFSISTPLSLVGSLFLIGNFPKIEVIIGALVCSICSCYLTVKHGNSLALRIETLILFSIIIAIILFFSYVAYIFGNFGLNTAVQKVESPSGNYYAEVIDSDQGALGGATFVEVYDNRGIELFFLKIRKRPKRVYTGYWGEFENMDIYWKDDTCLVINSVPMDIEW